MEQWALEDNWCGAVTKRGQLTSGAEKLWAPPNPQRIEKDVTSRNACELDLMWKLQVSSPEPLRVLSVLGNMEVPT
jgi:hypothetical protein